MNIRTLPATEAKNRFGRVLREVSQTGGPLIVERDGKPVAVILSIDEYERLQPQTILSAEQNLASQAFGLWARRDDIDEDWLSDGRSRWQSAWVDE
ncbi:MAG: type II toxin-antitoxin system Phd/YefM family antitoxin [Chloroflexi bacterium]|nr:type II toxin-antitoxin system Phd/YefM family antitoxin [Chloroflexota bacterium]